MAETGFSGPLIVYGQQPPYAPGYPPPDYNGDLGPSMFGVGVGFIDPRYGYKQGGQSLPQQAGNAPITAGFGGNAANLVAIDQAPSAVSTSNIAAAQNAVNGVALTLAAASGGISYSAFVLTVLTTGLQIPAGTLLVDGVPGNCIGPAGFTSLIEFGQNGAVGLMNPAAMLVRALSITGVTAGVGGAFLVRGFNLWGQPQTETITATAGATTTNGTKGWKFVTSITPQFADAHNYSVGTADIFEFPMRADKIAYVLIYWNNTLVTSPAGFVAANTATATALTGSTRGTYAIQADTSNGTKQLQVFIGVSVANSLPQNNVPPAYAGLFGITPA